LRREAGEVCTPGEYQCRFPDLAEDIAVQFRNVSTTLRH
jgi:hypothetical protein